MLVLGPWLGPWLDSQPEDVSAGQLWGSHTNRIHGLHVACQFFIFLVSSNKMMIFMCSYMIGWFTQFSSDLFLGNEQFLIFSLIVSTELSLPC